MSNSKPTFEHPPSLEQYMTSEKEFCVQNPQYHVICTGAVVFNDEGKMLLVQRARDEKAFPNYWEIPGGKVDDTDETILHGVVREVKEETGLDVTRIVRKVGEFGFEDYSKRRKQQVVWRKLIFEVEVKGMDVVLDPAEHQDYLFATEEEVMSDKAGETRLTWITLPNKEVNLDAFRLRREAQGASNATSQQNSNDAD